MKMGLFIKLIATIGVIAFAGLFVLKKPDGAPWLTLQDLGFRIPEFKLPKVSKDDPLGASSDTQVYKWKENGTWHYSEKLPTHLSPDQVEQLSINPDTNLIPAVKVKKEPELETPEQKSEPLDPSNELPTQPPGILNPQGIKDLIEDAQGVQQLMDERSKQIDAHL